MFFGSFPLYNFQFTLYSFINLLSSYWVWLCNLFTAGFIFVGTNSWIASALKHKDQDKFCLMWIYLTHSFEFSDKPQKPQFPHLDLHISVLTEAVMKCGRVKFLSSAAAANSCYLYSLVVV